MAVGFRKSLFGFNTGDVISYIDNMHSSFKNRETQLNAQLEELGRDLSLSKESYDELLSEKNEIAEKLNGFEEKYAEIQRMSDIIGKLYMVAQANAKAIIERTAENSRISDEEIGKNMDAINQAHTSLASLKEQLVQTSDGFLREIDMLCESLNDTRSRLETNSKAAKQNEQEFEKMFESLTNK